MWELVVRIRFPPARSLQTFGPSRAPCDGRTPTETSSSCVVGTSAEVAMRGSHRTHRGRRWIRTLVPPPTDLRLSRKSARLLARDRGVGADVSVQLGFGIIMPSPLEASGAPLCCSPVDPEDDKRDQVPTIRAICRTERCRGSRGVRAEGSGCQTRRKSACRWKLGTSSARSARQPRTMRGDRRCEPCGAGGSIIPRASRPCGDRRNRLLRTRLAS